jgi:hypothetical protein
MIAKLFDLESPYGRTTDVDNQGRPFIDRDGDIFNLILGYLRRGGRLIGTTLLSVDTLACLRDDAEYFGLKGLVDAVDQASRDNAQLAEEQKFAEERKRCSHEESEKYDKKKKRIVDANFAADRQSSRSYSYKLFHLDDKATFRDDTEEAGKRDTQHFGVEQGYRVIKTSQLQDGRTACIAERVNEGELPRREDGLWNGGIASLAMAHYLD